MEMSPLQRDLLRRLASVGQSINPDFDVDAFMADASAPFSRGSSRNAVTTPERCSTGTTISPQRPCAGDV